MLQVVVSELLPTVSCEVSFSRLAMPFVGEPDLRSLCRLRRDMLSLGMTDLFLFPCRVMVSFLGIWLYAGSIFASEIAGKVKKVVEMEDSTNDGKSGNQVRVE